MVARRIRAEGIEGAGEWLTSWIREERAREWLTSWIRKNGLETR